MSQDIAVFAQTTFRNQNKKFGIRTDDRRRHMYMIGKTGMGKSTVLENMIVDDIRAGYGLAVVDPHGDLAEKIIEFIPADRIKDIVYFNPSDMDFPIAFNVLEQVEPHLRHLVASGLLGVFQKLWADSWGPRLEYILRNAILAILDFPGSTILGVVRMLSDKSYRKRVVANIKDPVVKAFWEKEFASYADKFASEAVSPIQNKVGQFLSSSLMRNIIGQVKSTINIREIMDDGKILIMNLSKGRIGEDNSALLGAMMITKIQLAAMSRVDIPEEDRKDFFLYIDEFQNFSTDSFANILSEARKYRLSLILAHQYIEQLSEKVKPAVFGNVGTMVSFRVGATDAEELAKEYAPVFTEEDLVNLPKYEMYLKLMIDGVASAPFSARGLPPLTTEEKTHNTDKVIAYSREKYATSRVEVEEKILRWHEAQDDETVKKPVGASAKYSPPKETPSPKIARTQGRQVQEIRPEKKVPVFKENDRAVEAHEVSELDLKGARKKVEIAKEEKFILHETKLVASEIKEEIVPKTQKKGEEKSGYLTKCSSCGISTSTVFIPDGVRPVFCKECLAVKRQEKKEEADRRKIAKEQELKKTLEQTSKSIPSLSLSDLAKAQPVDFKGRPQRLKKRDDYNRGANGQTKANLNDSDGLNSVDQSQAGDMSEDEVIDFSRKLAK